LEREAAARCSRSYRSRERARLPHVDLHHRRVLFLLVSRNSQSHSAHRFNSRSRSDVNKSTASMVIAEIRAAKSRSFAAIRNSRPRWPRISSWFRRATRHCAASRATALVLGRWPSTNADRSSYRASRNLRARVSTSAAWSLRRDAAGRMRPAADASRMPARSLQVRRSPKCVSRSRGAALARAPVVLTKSRHRLPPTRGTFSTAVKVSGRDTTSGAL
jgi:hypothetical protein